MDDNSPKKTDLKDSKTIAKLVVDDRYGYLSEEIYVDLREEVSSRNRIVKKLNAATNWIKGWIKIYFPEYLTVYKIFSAESWLTVLEAVPLPQDVVKSGAESRRYQPSPVREEVACSWKRSQTLAEAELNRIGLDGVNVPVWECSCFWILEDSQTKRCNWKRSQWYWRQKR